LIEKFNFYDIYGYFLPGAVFLAALWGPYALVKGSWPSSSWGSAIIAIIFAYVAGHLIQSIATFALPASSLKTDSGQTRNFSEIYLDPKDDPKDAVLPAPFREKIQTLIIAQFGLNLEVNRKGDDLIDKLRNNAFLAARQMLIQGKAVSYAEQFQGMYALMRGLSSSFAIGFAYCLGWAIAVFKSQHCVEAAVVVAVASLLALVNLSLISPKISKPGMKRNLERWYAAILLLVFLAAGYLLGFRYSVKPHAGMILLSVSILGLIASLRSLGAYRFFAGQFAVTVWRDYIAYNVSLDLSQKPQSEKK
jgi:hypothetical protein